MDGNALFHCDHNRGSVIESFKRSAFRVNTFGIEVRKDLLLLAKAVEVRESRRVGDGSHLKLSLVVEEGRTPNTFGCWIRT